MTRRDAIIALATMAAIPLVGCAEHDPVIAFDRDSCEFCRMTISDRRFGGTARTARGRVVRFDSIECLASWLAKAEQPRGIWLVDALAPGTLVPLAVAAVYRDADVRSPMVAGGTTGSAGAGGYVAAARSHRNIPWAGATVPWADVLLAAR